MIKQQQARVIKIFICILLKILIVFIFHSQRKYLSYREIINCSSRYFLYAYVHIHWNTRCVMKWEHRRPYVHTRYSCTILEWLEPSYDRHWTIYRVFYYKSRIRMLRYMNSYVSWKNVASISFEYDESLKAWKSSVSDL